MDFEHFAAFMGMVIVAVIMIVALSETNKNLAKHNRELVSEVKKWKKKYAAKIKFFVELVKELRVKIQNSNSSKHSWKRL